MRCEEVRAVLLDAVEGELPEQRRPALREHLSECPECSGEYDRLRNASCALKDALTALAPEQTYLTRERRSRVVAAYRKSQRPIRLITWRRMVAAAAVAAIIAALPFIVSDAVRLFGRGGDRSLAQDSRDTSRMAVVFVRNGRAGTETPVSFAAARVGSPRAQGQADPTAVTVRTNTPGFHVPVDNDFYDSEQSSLWW